MTMTPTWTSDRAGASPAERDQRPGLAAARATLLCSIWSASAPPVLMGIEWEKFLAHARRARLVSRLAEHFRARGWLDDLPAGPAVLLRNALKESRRLHDETAWEATQLREALARVPTPIVLLKGAAYVLADLPPKPGRMFGDVDLLIERSQLRAAEGALLAKGWVAARLDPYDERYYRDLMHELPPMQHVERQTHIDVHHTVTPPTSRYAVDAAMLIAQRIALPRYPGLSVLAPCDMVLHSAAHLLQEGQFTTGLRDLLDLRDLLVHFGHDPAFGPRLLQRATQLGLATPLYYAWKLATELLAMPSDPAFAAAIERCAPRWPQRRLMLRLLATVMLGNDPAGPQRAETVARWLLYVRSHWLRMPWYQILPHLARKAWARAKPKPPSPPDRAEDANRP